MKKIFRFLLNIFLGLIYGWSGIVLASWSGYIGASLNLANYIFMFSPLLLTSATIFYLIWKKKGYISVIGIILGFILGFLLLMLGLGLGGA